jgi:hypothetical protein
VTRDYQAVAPIIAGSHQDNHRHTEQSFQAVADSPCHRQAGLLHQEVQGYACLLAALFYLAHLV